MNVPTPAHQVADRVLRDPGRPVYPEGQGQPHSAPQTSPSGDDDELSGQPVPYAVQEGAAGLNRLVGLVVMPSESGRSEVRIPLALGIFSIPVTSKLALRWLPCQAPGVIGSVLGQVDRVSVYCNWVRWKV